MQTTPHKTTLEQWRVLQAVIDYGGFVPAAEALHRSHSTLSHAVNKLQEQLGVRLLTIRGRKAQLTPEGELLLRHSRALTRVARSLENMAGDIGECPPQALSLLVDHSYPMEWLAAVLAGLDAQTAGAIRWRAASPAECRAAIEDASADLIITSSGVEHVPGEPCAQVQLLPVATPALAAVLAEQGATARLAVLWQESELEREARWQVASPEAALALVRQGAGWAQLPEHLVEYLVASGELQQLPAPDFRQNCLALQLFAPSRNAQSDAGRALRGMLLDGPGLDSEAIRSQGCTA